MANRENRALSGGHRFSCAESFLLEIEEVTASGIVYRGFFSCKTVVGDKHLITKEIIPSGELRSSGGGRFRAYP